MEDYDTFAHSLDNFDGTDQEYKQLLLSLRSLCESRLEVITIEEGFNPS